MAKRQANREIMIQGYISCIWGDYKVKEELYNNQQTAVDLFTFAMSKTKKDPYLEAGIIDYLLFINQLVMKESVVVFFVISWRNHRIVYISLQ